MASAFVRPGLPLFLRGTVVKGFGRGSKELGIPTANLPEETVEAMSELITTGIYFGFASVNRTVVQKMVMSVGWNPFYNNQKRSAEVHILHKYDADFYGEELSIVALGYIRPEQNFTSLESLVEAIQNDIQVASEALDLDDFKKHSEDDFSRDRSRHD
eukprot:Opistho-2@96866